MKIVSVIPFAKGMDKENLSYFSQKEIPLGSIVSVPIRKKLVDALVVESLDLSQAKSLIKTSGFSLRKIEKVKGLINLNEPFLNSIFKIKDYFSTSTGAALSSLLPKSYLENYEKLAHFHDSPNFSEKTESKKNNLRVEKLALQNSLAERISFYKTFIRESFAKKKSILICVPRAQDVEFFAENVKKGIEEYVVPLHSGLSKKDFIKNYNTIIEESHPILIVTTPMYLFVAQNNLSAIILERESSSAYRQISRPFIDLRVFAEILAQNLRTKIILSDTLLRIETLERLQKGEVTEILPASYRVSHGENKEVIDLNIVKEKKFKAVSAPLLEKIKAVSKDGGQSFLFVLRKGLAPITICNDCKNLLLCDFCAKPMVLYQSENKKRIFVCHHCRHKLDTLIKCKTCESWDLRMLGVGTEKVYEEITEHFPKDKVFRLDKENAKTPQQALKIIAKFYKTAGGILIGTEMALHYMEQTVANVAVISFDSLFSIPNFKMGEKIIHLLLELNDLTEKNLFIQTKNKDDHTLNHFLSGNLAQFGRDEISNREKFNYPPFMSLIKINFRGSKTAVSNAEELLQKELKNYNPLIYKAYLPKIKNTYILSAMIRVKKKDWSLPEINPGGNIDEALLSKLRSLPQSFSIQIDPEDIL